MRGGGVLMTLAGVAVLAAGCGTQVAGGPSQAGPLSAAVTRTGAQTSRVAATITMQMQSMSFSYTATGVFDFARSRGLLSMPQPMGLTELFIPPDVYVKFSAGGPALPRGKTWFVISDGGIGAASSALGPFGGNANPADLLKSLTGISGSEKKAGTATIRGVTVTEYQVNIDPAKAAARLPGSQRASFRQFAAALGSGAIPVDVWVDNQNLVRRVQVSVHLLAGSGAPAGARLTESTDFYDFGVPVRVAAPPALQVAGLSQMIAGAAGKSAGISLISGGSGSSNPPKVTGTLTPAQADAAEQTATAFWTALGRNDPASVAATVLPSQRSCASSGLDGAPRVTVSGFRTVSAEPAGDGRATVRFTVNATLNLGGQEVPLDSTGDGPMWLVAVERAGHWYVDLSATADFPFGAPCWLQSGGPGD
jgi:hypothetical protein